MTDDVPHARRHPWIGWLIAAVVVALLFLVGWVALRGLGAAASLSSAAQTAASMRAQIAAGQVDALHASAKRVAADAANARLLTDDPVWRAAEATPWLGGTLRGMRQISVAADDVGRLALPPLVEAAKVADLATAGLTGATFDDTGLVAASGPLTEAARSFAAAERLLRDVDADGMVGPFGGAAKDALAELRTASRATSALAGAAGILPVFAPSGDSRNVLVLVQSNATLRSSGGTPDAFALLRVAQGTISVVRTADARVFGTLPKPVGPLPEATTALFGPTPAVRMADALSSPSFADGAALAARMWTAVERDRVDAVIGVDTVTLGALVAVTGPLTVDGVALGEADAAETLLGIARARPQPGQAAAFAGAALAAELTALRGASTNVQRLLATLLDAGDAQRVRVWFADPAVQKLLAASTLAGTLPADTGGVVHLAVLVNDTTGGAIDQFATAAVSTRIGTCGGRAVVEVAVELANAAPDDAASLPAAVVGTGAIPPGTMGTRIAVVGPAGWTVTRTDATGETAGDTTADVGGRAAVQHELRTPPGSTQRVTVRFTAPAATATAPRPVVRTTPMATPTPVRSDALACG